MSRELTWVEPSIVDGTEDSYEAFCFLLIFITILALLSVFSLSVFMEGCP